MTTSLGHTHVSMIPSLRRGRSFSDVVNLPITLHDQPCPKPSHLILRTQLIELDRIKDESSCGSNF